MKYQLQYCNSKKLEINICPHICYNIKRGLNNIGAVFYMKDNIINVNFTARHKRKVKFKNYIISKLKRIKDIFVFKGKYYKESKDNKNYHKSTM
jgi:hypothetical protein